jgi:putative transposase
VPKQLKRYYGSGDLHFITCSCYRREGRLMRGSLRDLFLKVLENLRHRYRFYVIGYVVMPEHFHLLMSEPELANPTTVMQVLKQIVAKTVLKNSGDKCFWQSRFYDFNVWTEKKRVEKLRYMHHNPVARGLVAKPEHWRWSSYADYALGRRGPVLVATEDWLPTLREKRREEWGTPGMNS